MNFNKALIIITFVSLGVLALVSYFGFNYIKTLESQYNELSQLSDTQKFKIQEFNKELGLAKSQLMTEKDFNEKFKIEIEELNKKIGKMSKKAKVKPRSIDQTVVDVGGEIVGGDSGVSESESGQISYFWLSQDKRFHLIDPDIYISGDEEFSYKINVRLTGILLKDETGLVQARQIKAEEVEIGPDGTIRKIRDLDIVENSFTYINDVKQKEFLSIFDPRIQFIFDTNLNPGVALEVVNFGNYFDWANVGINAQASINVKDGLEGLGKSAVGVGLSYNLIRPLFDTNISFGIGVLTPTDDLLNRWILTGNIGFYLTN